MHIMGYLPIIGEADGILDNSGRKLQRTILLQYMPRLIWNLRGDSGEPPYSLLAKLTRSALYRLDEPTK